MARVDPSEIVDAFELAARLIGPECIVVLDRLAAGARLRRVDDGYRIELRDALPDINFACSHELAHWALREVWGSELKHEEQMANYLGAALLMPRAVVRAVVKRYGRSLGPVRPLARLIKVSKTASQLRLAEVLGDERAIVTRTGNLIVRNAAQIDWSDPSILLTRRRDFEHPSLAKAAFLGGIDHGRVALTPLRA